jgi:hypothetical protein
LLREYNNIHVIGNRLISDQEGFYIGVEEPVIHVYNKVGTNFKEG